MTQEVQPPRISENPENYASVFDAAMDAAKRVGNGGLEVSEATAISRNLGVASKTLDGDLKSRIVERRFQARQIDAARQIAAPRDAA